MKRFFLAAAAAPLLIACTTAAASEMNAADRDGESRVLLINGERIEIREGESAGAALTAALEGGPGDARQARHNFDFDFDFEFDGSEWSDKDRAEFEEAVEEMAEALAGLERDLAVFSDVDEERIRVRVAQIERFHDAHGERMEVHARRMAAHGAQMAERAQGHAQRMRIVGLSAGLNGMESGLHGIDRALERGWVREDGERRALTNDEIEDLREARADLESEIQEFREEHADVLNLLEDEGHREVYLQRLSTDAPDLPPLEGGRQVRVQRSGDDVRVWVDGEELEGEDREAWLEEHEGGEPSAPPAPPQPPRP